MTPVLKRISFHDSASRVCARVRTVGTRQNSRFCRSRTMRSRTLPKGPKLTPSRIMDRSRTIGCTNLAGNCFCLETVLEGPTPVPDFGPRASLALLVCTTSKLLQGVGLSGRLTSRAFTLNPKPWRYGRQTESLMH